MSDDNVVTFDHPTKLDLPPERILNGALTQELSGVVVIGWTKDGEEYFASSMADGAEVIWLMERFKLQLLAGE